MTTGRVFLHVGAPKSGTTFLQSILWANRDRLRATGLLVPGKDQFDAFYATMQVRQVSRSEGLPARAVDAWPRLVDEARAWGRDSVISHEFFAAASTRQAARARADLAPLEVHVIVTARDYVDQLPALWQEQVKVGSTDPFDTFVDDMLGGRRSGPLSWRTTDVPSVLRRWTASLPSEQVHLVTVPPPGSAPLALWDRFCDALGLEPSGWEIPQTRRNQSLGVVEAELLRRINPRLRPPLGRAGAPHYRWVRRYLAEDVLVSRGGRRFGVDASTATQLRARSKDALDYVTSRGLRVHGDLADLVSSDPSARREPAETTDEDVLDAALETIAVLLDRLRRDHAKPRATGPDN